jgi:CheY-like chemotaxis protein
VRAAALHKEPFEVVIIDHLLPDMTGVELADAIKTASERVEQQIILLTSFDRDVGQIAARALGPSDKADAAIGIVGLHCGERSAGSGSYLCAQKAGGGPAR